MIEIGRPRSETLFTRRIASAFGTMAAVLLLAWLVRSILAISQFSTDILLTSFALIFLSGVFHTRTRSGAGRAVSSFLWNVALACIVIAIATWFLGWVASVQSTTLPSMITSQVPYLVIVAIAAGLLGYAVRELTPRGGRIRAAGPAIVVRPDSEVKAARTTIATKADSVALPIARHGRTVGCVVFGDLKASFETPMGRVTASYAGPVTTFGIPFRGNKAGREEAAKVASQNVDQLIRRAQTDPSGLRPNGDWHDVDLPFVHVTNDWFGESVDVGPISVRHGLDGDNVRIGSFEINSDDHEPGFGHRHHHDDRHASWLARGTQESAFLRVSDEVVSARWNGSSLWMKGDSMKLTISGDGFEYSPTEIKTFSPLHTLHVANQKMTLDTRKFTLNVTAERVVLRAESGSKSTDSPGLAQDLKNLFTEEAKKHVQDVMKGVPIDLDEMLSSTEEVLKKYE